MPGLDFEPRVISCFAVKPSHQTGFEVDASKRSVRRFRNGEREDWHFFATNLLLHALQNFAGGPIAACDGAVNSAVVASGIGGFTGEEKRIFEWRC